MDFRSWLINEEQQEIEQQLAQWQPMILRYAKKFAGDSHEADDIAQNASISIFKAMQKGVIPQYPTSWIYQIVQNHARDLFRRLNKRSGALPDDLTSSDPGDQLDAAERQGRVRSALGDLTGQHQDILHGRYYEDEPEETSASRLGIPKGTVKSRVNAAKKALMKALRSRGVDSA